MTTVTDILSEIDSFAPFNTAMQWDNCGLLIGDASATVKGITLCMDVTTEVVEESVKLEHNVIIAHHPIIFGGIKNIPKNTAVYACVKNDMNIIAAHTNLDISSYGTNFALASAIGLINTEFFPAPSIGMVGYLQNELSTEAFTEKLNSIFGLLPRRNPSKISKISCVGLCSGAGADEAIFARKKYSIDAFVTADVKHHQFIEAANAGFILFDCGHFATEALVLEHLKMRFLKYCTNVSIATAYNGQLL